MKVYIAQDLNNPSDTTVLFTSKAKALYYAGSINQSDFDGEEIYTVEVKEFEISKQGILNAIVTGAIICGGGTIKIGD